MPCQRARLQSRLLVRPRNATTARSRSAQWSGYLDFYGPCCPLRGRIRIISTCCILICLWMGKDTLVDRWRGKVLIFYSFAYTSIHPCIHALPTPRFYLPSRDKILSRSSSAHVSASSPANTLADLPLLSTQAKSAPYLTNCSTAQGTPASTA